MEKFEEVGDEQTGELRLKLERKGMTKVEVEAEMQRLDAGRGSGDCEAAAVAAKVFSSVSVVKKMQAFLFEPMNSRFPVSPVVVSSSTVRVPH